jgi:hypothetical protein
MKTILHISHHIGCFRDQQYILNKLGYKVINLKFYDNQFTVTSEIASTFWLQYKDIINSCDYVLISDTSPISRCILQHFNEFRSKLIIWICNRFDYGMINELEYYSLFEQYKNKCNVKIVASTFWEKIWCLKNKIDIMDCFVINPLGMFDNDLEKFIPQSKIYDEWYNNTSNITEADVYVPFYRNDNIFFNLSSFLSENKITVCNTTFSNPNQLKQFKAYVTLPDTFCKWFSFEAIHLKLPVILPSKTLLLKLCKNPNYLYNVTGYGGAELMTEDLISIGEWYNPKFEKCRVYFDSFEDLPNTITSLNKQNMNSEFEKCSFQHEQEILTKWKNIYETF